jgi:hypothetical protein
MATRGQYREGGIGLQRTSIRCSIGLFQGSLGRLSLDTCGRPLPLATSWTVRVSIARSLTSLLSGGTVLGE